MKKQQVLITAPAHPCLKQGLERDGYEVTVEMSPDTSWLAANIYRFHGIVVASKPVIDKDLIDVAVELQWIARLGSGMEHIDVEYAESRGIRCINSPEGNCGAVAEHVIGLLITLMRKIYVSAEELKQGKWVRDMQRGEMLTEKVVGIIGLGNTGTALAYLLASFGVIVFAHDKYRKKFGSTYVRESTLEEIQKYCHIVSLHLPLTEETFHYADAKFFSGFQKRPYFVNTGRGQLVDTDALISALQKDQIKAAALDVLENEQLETYTPEERKQLDVLLADPRVLITPHIAGYSQESYRKLSEVILKKLDISCPSSLEIPDVDW